MKCEGKDDNLVNIEENEADRKTIHNLDKDVLKSG